MLTQLLLKITKVERGELSAVLLSCGYFFFVLCGYFILRPLREEMGLAGGVRNLPWLFLGTLSVVLLVTPFFGALVSRTSRRVFIPVVYRFFIANIFIFFALLKLAPEHLHVHIGRVFYVWISVFNMFAVSIFWSTMADGWRLNQSKRLFGVIGIGGTLGAVAGAFITGQFVETIGRIELLLVSAVMLELAVQCVRRLWPHFERNPRVEVTPAGSSAPIQDEGEPGGGFLEGITLTARSPYLLGISAYILLFTIGSTFLYFEQANIVNAMEGGRATHVAIFAKIDFWVQALTLLTQLSFTSRIIGKLGVGPTLLLLPALTGLGFVALGVAPILPILVLFQVLRRSGNHAIVRPARETLFTVLSRREKYKAKSFIDTFVYRGGDALGASLYDGLTRLGLGLAGIAFSALPLVVLWGGVGLFLGLKQRRIAHAHAVEDASLPGLSPAPAEVATPL